MELDAPCRGLKLKNFKEMISNVADIFRTQALEQFGEIKCKSLLNIFSYQCNLFTKKQPGPLEIQNQEELR